MPDSASEIREGATYQSSIALRDNQESEEIPKLFFIRQLKNVLMINAVWYHLKWKPLPLLQLSGVAINSSFNRYVFPVTAISSYSSKVTGLSVVGNTLLLKGKPVQSLHECLNEFVPWVQSFDESEILYGHNVKFDSKALFQACRKVGFVESYKDAIVGFSDTLSTFYPVWQGGRWWLPKCFWPLCLNA